MRSIKPGRGPSSLGAIGSIAVGAFGVFWTLSAASMGAPPFFVIFGVVFVGLAIIQGIYHFMNATRSNRMSLLDITEHGEEPDPLNVLAAERKGSLEQPGEKQLQIPGSVNYCPFCGNKITDPTHKYCMSCGKEIRGNSM
ncbi:zinc ribbon domain-containing protein [Paenibacillus sp. HJGM_3]|uniref:zinc ribbon domain-containing protein n=1 Tax=Paenibacillus sp. HJGM_3 TaxID=3379816 RepID=UPI00385BD630